MKKLFSFILMLLCIAGANAQQTSQTTETGNAQRKPEAVLVIGDKIVTDLEKVSLEDFIGLPCTLQVQSFVKDQSFDVASFQVMVDGMMYDCKGNAVSEAVKEKMKRLESVSMVYFQSIKVRGKDGPMMMLKPLVVQFDGDSVKK